MTRVRRPYDVQKIKMAAVLQLKINNYILETKISFLPCFYIGTTWVFIRMCTIVTSMDMTSFVYIGDEKTSSVEMAWKGNEMTRTQKKLCYLY